MNNRSVETLGVQVGDIVEVTINLFFQNGDTNKGFVRSIRNQKNKYNADTSWYEIVPFGRTPATLNSPSGDSFDLSIMDYGRKWKKVQ